MTSETEFVLENCMKLMVPTLFDLQRVQDFHSIPIIGLVFLPEVDSDTIA
jgi:hypothetical protein